jgi:hypothetical protein
MSKHKPNSGKQASEFIKVARELGCDESEVAFDEKLKKVAAHKPTVAAPKDEKKPK